MAQLLQEIAIHEAHQNDTDEDEELMTLGSGENKSQTCLSPPSSSNSLFRSIISFGMSSPISHSMSNSMTSSMTSQTQPLTKYPGLLHRKLFDLNLLLRKQLVDVSLFPYKSSGKRVQSLTHDMFISHRAIKQSATDLENLKHVMERSLFLMENISRADLGI